jgi:PAS domain-containing protein
MLGRSAKLVLEWLAWVLILSTVVFFGFRWRAVLELQTNRVLLDRLPETDISPREALLSLRTAALSCLKAPMPNADYQRLRSTAEKFSGEFNLYYHAEIDTERFTQRSYGESGNDDFGKCLGTKMLPKTVSLARLDSRVLWMYAFLETPKRQVFIVWPNSAIPSSFNPWERPWYRTNVQKSYRIKTLINRETLFETFPFLDAFTGEQIISLSLPEQVQKGTFLTTVVDVQAGATPTIYSRMLCLNLVMSVAILGFSFLIQRSFQTYYSKCWYRAWLGVACLYSVSAYSYFGQWTEGFSVPVASMREILPPLLSIVNDGFFLLTALALWKPSNLKTQRSLSLKIGASVLGIFFLAWILEERLGVRTVSIGECVEALFTAIVLILFGAALTAVLKGCANSLDSVRWPLSSHKSRFVEIKWAPVGSVMINCFFAFCALLQLSIPFWRLRPYLEDLFLFSSVPMKVGFVAIFYSVVLVELYSEKFRANQVYSAAIAQGVVMVDEDFRVTTANEVAVDLIRLPVDVMRGKHLKQILFRSLFEAEEIMRVVALGEPVEGRKIKGKRFGDNPNEIEDADFWVTASLVGRGISGRTKALFVISDATPRERSPEEETAKSPADVLARAPSPAEQ